jgi:hypothetical protein
VGPETATGLPYATDIDRFAGGPCKRGVALLGQAACRRSERLAAIGGDQQATGGSGARRVGTVVRAMWVERAVCCWYASCGFQFAVCCGRCEGRQAQMIRAMSQLLRNQGRRTHLTGKRRLVSLARPDWPAPPGDSLAGCDPACKQQASVIAIAITAPIMAFARLSAGHATDSQSRATGACASLSPRISHVVYSHHRHTSLCAIIMISTSGALPFPAEDPYRPATLHLPDSPPCVCWPNIYWSYRARGLSPLFHPPISLRACRVEVRGMRRRREGTSPSECVQNASAMIRFAQDVLSYSLEYLT